MWLEVSNFLKGYISWYIPFQSFLDFSPNFATKIPLVWCFRGWNQQNRGIMILDSLWFTLWARSTLLNGMKSALPFFFCLLVFRKNNNNYNFFQHHYPSTCLFLDVVFLVLHEKRPWFLYICAFIFFTFGRKLVLYFRTYVLFSDVEFHQFFFSFSFSLLPQPFLPHSYWCSC